MTYETYADDLDDDGAGERDDVWDDDDYEREDDPEDAEQAKAYAEFYDHCESRHGGGACDCRPSRITVARVRLGNAAQTAAWRIRGARYWLTRSPHFLRFGPLEISVRLRRECGACSGRGWNHSKGGLNPLPAPPGYDGAGLCSCGSAISRIADSAAYLRKARKEVPF